MYRAATKYSREDLKTTNNSFLHESTGFDNQSFHSTRQNQQQTKATTYYEADHSPAPRRHLSPPSISTNNHNDRARSADHSLTVLNETTPMGSSSSPTYASTFNNKATSRLSRASNARSNRTNGTRSSTVYIDEQRVAQQGEKRELNTLNDRFGNYLDKIKHLANINANLRRQVDGAYRKYMGHTDEQQIEVYDDKKMINIYQHPSEIQLNHLRKQINDEVRAQTVIQIRLQRADYDIKFYQNNIKLLSQHDQKQSDQVRTMRQQLEVNLHELEQLKRQYERREQDLQKYKSEYDEYINKLIQFTNEYDQITYERMENENTLYTLKEQLSFEHEYYQRRQQEFEYIEKFHYDFNKEFNKTEFHNIVKQIRQDYQEFNAIRLSELEILYKSKLDTIRNQFHKRDEQPPPQDVSKIQEVRVVLDSTKKEHRTLIEKNQLLTNKLEQLERDLQDIIELNRQHHEVSDRELKQLQMELPELDCIIVHLRENTGSLWSEINTYRYLLVNLLSTTNENSQQQQQQHITKERIHSSRSKSSQPFPSLPSIDKTVPNEKYTTTSTTTDNNIQESKNSLSMMKPSSNKVTTTTTTTTVGTKAKPYIEQYRDETTGFIVHIEDGIIWVRI